MIITKSMHLINLHDIWLEAMEVNGIPNIVCL